MTTSLETLLSPLGIFWAALALLLSAALTLLIDLKLSRSMVIAGARAFLQLWLVGWILQYLFLKNSLPWTLSAITLMTVVATHAVLSRVRIRYPGRTIQSFLSLLGGAWISGLYASTLILGQDQWKEAQTLLPFVGILLGNGLTGISLGLQSWTKQLYSQRSQIEEQLALGATHWEASRPLAREAFVTGLTPILNSMSVVGIVSLPGILTGQLLAGADPQVAVLYQIALLFLIATSTTLGLGVAVFLSLRSCFNSRHQLLWHLLVPMDQKGGAK